MKLLELISYITLCSFAIAILAAIAYYNIDEAEKNAEIVMRIAATITGCGMILAMVIFPFVVIF